MASKIGSWFETRKRDSGESFVTLKDGRPEWLRDAVHEAHGDSMPEDWIYAECEAACDAFDGGYLKDEDAIHEHADGRVDVYTKDLFQWAADYCLSSMYSNAEDEAKDLLGDESDTNKRFSAIQYCAISTIARVMLVACEEHENDDESEDETGT